MKDCILILPYFGKFKDIFPVFLKSCEFNKKIDWLIITDDLGNYDYPENVKVIHMLFEEFKKIIQSKFTFSIELTKPYKLCDYKPAYGYICEEWIQGYRYWGHCDCDLIFGDIYSVLFEKITKKYDKIFAAGHLTLYLNTHANNRRFMHSYPGYGEIYKIVYTQPQIFAFDESLYKINVHSIFIYEKCRIYDLDISYNVSTKKHHLVREYYEPIQKEWVMERRTPNLIFWEQGKIVEYTLKNNIIFKREFLYIHLQNRNLKILDNIANVKNIQITPIAITSVNKIPSTAWEWNTFRKSYISKAFFYMELREIYYDLRGRGIPPYEHDPYMSLINKNK